MDDTNLTPHFHMSPKILQSISTIYTDPTTAPESRTSSKWLSVWTVRGAPFVPQVHLSQDIEKYSVNWRRRCVIVS